MLDPLGKPLAADGEILNNLSLTIDLNPDLLRALLPVIRPARGQLLLAEVNVDRA